MLVKSFLNFSQFFSNLLNFFHQLQDWVCNNLKEEISYATGISVMDAAYEIPRSQIDNGLEDGED